MVCRLARRTQQSQAQSLPLQNRSPPPPDQDARPSLRKKSPRLGTAREILEAYAECFPPSDQRRAAARQLAQLVGHVRPHQLTQLHVETLATRWRADNARNTVRLKLAGLKRTLRAFAASTGTPDLSFDVPRGPHYQQRNVTATPDELNKLFTAAQPIERIWLRLTVALALGQAEALALCEANYNPENKTVSFVRKKTKEPNTLPVPDDVALLFEQAPDTGDKSTPYLERWNGAPLTYWSINGRWQRLKKRAGVRREITPHDLRRTTAIALYEVSHDLRAVQQLLGHATLHSAVHYVAHADPSKLRPLLAQLWTPRTQVKQ